MSAAPKSIGHGEPITSPPLVDAAPEQRMRVGFSGRAETREAIEEVLRQVRAEHAALTLVFFGARHDPQEIAHVLDRVTQARGVAGCSSGELSGLGFSEGGMVAMSLSGVGVRAVVEVIAKLDHLSLVPLVQLPCLMARRLKLDMNALDGSRHIWLTLIDGGAARPGMLTSFFAQHAGKLPLVGGALSPRTVDGICLVHHGRTYRNAAAFILLDYPHPFALVRSTHHELGSRWMEVTRTSEDGVIVYELDGEPAARVYAELLGLRVEELVLEVTGCHPLGMRFRGRAFAVGVVGVTPDGGLRVGLPLQRGEQVNALVSRAFLEQSAQSLDMAQEQLGAAHPAQGLLLFQCLGRYMEAQRTGQLEALHQALSQVPMVGLHTLGEQYGAIYYNHAMTGVMFG